MTETASLSHFSGPRVGADVQADSRSGRSRGFLGRSASAGFTLIEIMVVLAILALLASVFITGVGKALNKAKVSTTQLFVTQTMRTALTNYNIDVGEYPSTEEGLSALVSAPSEKADRWRGPYVEGGKVPLDAWGHPYKYLSPGAHNKDTYDIWSMGPSGVDGGADNIGNW